MNKGIDEQVETLNNVILNIMPNFVLNKDITINDKDSPWITSYIKNKISYKKKFLKNGRNVFDWNRVDKGRNELILNIVTPILHQKFIGPF